jgi:chaperone modulatory protein CbpM
MRVHISESVWLNEADVCSIEHLAEVSGLSQDELRDLMESGVIVPAEDAGGTLAFPLHYIVTVKTARRLRDDFELDRNGLVMALTLLRRIQSLETELRAALSRHSAIAVRNRQDEKD